MAIMNELEGNNLGLSPNRALVYWKRAYYSRYRDAPIKFDVVIEVWQPRAEYPSFLWICECKDLKGPLPVDDVEEFLAKLDQISGANRKGVIAISGGIQSGALKYARSKGIGIIRLLPDDQVHYELYYKGPEPTEDSRHRAEECYRALTEADFVGINREFYAVSSGLMFRTWGSLLASAIHLGA